ncbi:anti-sigma factor antagonist BldG [Marihabitans asiaticum]|uniref:Anti-sigma factor antagonist n=1 Tax=Marihabitans asiaticum TaxID=415218 RepID=A0A560WDV4_9MICO|nr:STAS domain-containing protein [Marihabitans asiaticum]TWD15710.1 anti-sigma B factor antagonist [Marihabitans asiaticum]
MTLTLATSETHDVAVVACSGEIDATNAGRLRDAVQEQIQAGHLHVALDLTEVTFLDSTGLGVIVGRLKTLRREGGALTIAVTAPRVRRVFEITGLDKVFTLHESIDEAAREAGEARDTARL